MASPAKTAYEKGDGKGNTLRDLVVDHLPLVGHIVGRLCAGIMTRVPREDLVGAGTLGLVEAAHRFDPAKGVKFSTYAYSRVRGAVVDYLRRNDPIGKVARDQLYAVRRCVSECQRRYGRRPSIEEIAARTGIPEEDVVQCLSYEKWRYVESLEASADGAGCDESPLAVLLPAEGRTPLEELEWEERIQRVARAVEDLPERERQIIVMYYYEELYMSEMAHILQITEGRVSQLHTRALYNLSRKLEGTDGR
jgi:RNA polymerase sigma factor for flagellar operon FliA